MTGDWLAAAAVWLTSSGSRDWLEGGDLAEWLTGLGTLVLAGVTYMTLRETREAARVAREDTREARGEAKRSRDELEEERAREQARHVWMSPARIGLGHSARNITTISGWVDIHNDLGSPVDIWRPT